MNEVIKQKLEDIFRLVFELPSDAKVGDIQQIDFDKWDSLSHVSLMSAIENEFGLEVDIAESISLTSFESIELYLSRKVV